MDRTSSHCCLHRRDRYSCRIAAFPGYSTGFRGVESFKFLSWDLRFAVAVFVMISGTLYLDSKRNWSLKKLWRKNILQIAAAYAFWQFFYAVYRIVVSGNMEGPVLFLKKVLIYCSSSYFHLWYLPMLAGLLAVTPLLWEIVNCERGKKWEEYLILLFLIFKILPYTMNCFSFPLKEYVMDLMYTIQPGMIVDYAGYFVLGHYLSHYEIPKKMEKTVYILGVVLIITAILLCQIMSPREGREIQAYYENSRWPDFSGEVQYFCFSKIMYPEFSGQRNRKK